MIQKIWFKDPEGSASLSLLFFVSRINTSSATELAWSTWEALITMQHNPTQKDTLRRVRCLLWAISTQLHQSVQPDEEASRRTDEEVTGDRGQGTGEIRGDRTGQDDLLLDWCHDSATDPTQTPPKNQPWKTCSHASFWFLTEFSPYSQISASS